MRSTLAAITFALLSSFLLTGASALPTIATASMPPAGTTMTGPGQYDFSSDGEPVCDSAGTIVIAFGALDAAVTVTFVSAEDPACTFVPDTYAAAACSTDAHGTLTCSYIDAGGAVSSFALTAAGAVTYSFDFSTGDRDDLVGTVTPTV